MLVKFLCVRPPPSLGPGGLDEAVEAFRNPVGDLALEPAQHAIPVIHDGVGNLDLSTAI